VRVLFRQEVDCPPRHPDGSGTTNFEGDPLIAIEMGEVARREFVATNVGFNRRAAKSRRFSATTLLALCKKS
jgi:hypothetical protein